MSGHSKWATIKRSKAVVDAKRGKIFTKVAKEIIQAAQIGGGNADMNPRLRTAILAAKAVNMPSDNIKKAIMKGTGELAGEALEDIMYEGYGPGGVAVMVETTTDNKNRTASEIRGIFTRYGNLGEPGSVAWMFQKKGQIIVNKKAIGEDELMGLALDAGAEDIAAEDDVYTITTAPADLEKVYTAIKTKTEPESSEIAMIPQNYVAIEELKVAEQVLKFLDVIDDQDDVQKVYSNFDIPEELLEKLKGA
jgi:YebC/PmpR family DNA-binding regulatory protein